MNMNMIQIVTSGAVVIEDRVDHDEFINSPFMIVPGS